MARLRASIREFGWTNPILVGADGYVLAGHARLEVAKEEGIEEVPVIRLPLEGDSAIAYMVADNRLSELSEWDMPVLKDVLEGLDTGAYDVELTGFDMGDIEQMMTANLKSPLVCPECGYEFVK